MSDRTARCQPLPARRAASAALFFARGDARRRREVTLLDAPARRGRPPSLAAGAWGVPLVATVRRDWPRRLHGARDRDRLTFRSVKIRVWPTPPRQPRDPPSPFATPPPHLRYLAVKIPDPPAVRVHRGVLLSTPLVAAGLRSPTRRGSPAPRLHISGGDFLGTVVGTCCQHGRGTYSSTTGTNLLANILARGRSPTSTS